MKRLRLGVIGCGDITKYTLLMAKLNRKIQIAACADKQIERAQKYAKHFRGAKAFSDYTEMISSTELDAVYLAVPHFLHYPIMLDLLDHNLNILCEKPITTNIEDAKDIIQKAEEKNLKVVNFFTI